MTIKIIGATIVFIFFSIIGFYYSYKPLYRKNDLLEIKKAILILNSEIKFLSTSIIEATYKIENLVENPIKNVFVYFRSLIEIYDGKSIEEIWIRAVDNALVKSYLNSEDIKNFKSIGKYICSYDKELSLNGFNLILSYIDNAILQIENQSNKHIKMYQSLGVLTGLIIIILLF